MPKQSQLSVPASTLVELVRWRAQESPEAGAISFLKDGKTEEEFLTYKELDERAQSIAVELRSYAEPGDAVLINHNAGLDYVASFFGCLYAGITAVPVYPPRFNQKLDRVDAIVADVQPKASLTSTSILETLAPQFDSHPPLRSLPWVETDAISNQCDQWVDPKIGPDHLAFLQYTSGSTGNPKGVMLTHGTLLENLECIRRSFETYHPDQGSLVWLPPYHDMGLIGGILGPIYSGFQARLMSPFTFLMRPFRWLEALSRYKTTFSGAPNFAYELCVRRIPDKKVKELDLSHWKLAFCGAEPIRPEVLNAFADKFEPAGFDRKALYPCYGLAESTLMVTGGTRGAGLQVKYFDPEVLEKQGLAKEVGETAEKARALVSCGRAVQEHKVRIVNPDTGALCDEGQVGEIWVEGPSVAKGYLNKDELNQIQFEAVPKERQGHHLRTGDLGFLLDGELYVTGRIKDLVIIRGRNLYPQDIERTVELSHPALQSCNGAAVSIDGPDGEGLVIIQEVSRREGRNVDLQALAKRISEQVLDEHGVAPAAIALIKANSIPQTSSGKIQRQHSKRLFLEGGLEELERVTVNA